MDPPVSDPSATVAKLAATAAAEPPLDPPGTRVRSRGLWVGIKTGVFRRRTHGEFVAIRLAEDDGPRALQPFDRRGVVRRDEILQDARRTGGAGSAGQDDVLDRDRHAGQGSERFAGGNRLVHLLRLREGALRAQAEVGADFLVLLLDARQVGLGDFDSRRLPALQKLTYLADR